MTRIRHLRSWAILGVGATLLGSSACHRSADTADAKVAAAPTWNWQAFPEAKELLLAQLPATVTPARMEVVRAPASGQLRLSIASSAEAAVTAGQAWATIEPDDAADEAASLTHLRQTMEERHTRYLRDERPFALARLDKEIADAEETLALAKFAERSPEAFRGDTPGLDPRLQPTLTAKQAEEQLRLLRERRERMAADAPDTEPVDLQGLRVEIEQRERTQAQRQAHLILHASFAGRLRLASGAAVQAHVAAGEVVATLEDTSSAEVRVPATLPLLHAVAPESLRVEVTLPGGAAAQAAFFAVTVELQGDTPLPVLRFRLDGKVEPPPPGVQLPALVYTRLPASARIVPKLELVRYDAAGALNEGWKAGIARLFPGNSLLAEGRQAVAIVPTR